MNPAPTELAIQGTELQRMPVAKPSQSSHTGHRITTYARCHNTRCFNIGELMKKLTAQDCNIGSSIITDTGTIITITLRHRADNTGHGITMYNLPKVYNNR